jgi:phage minor structural protein
MIPILFPATAQSFSANGLGRLSDAISCEVREVLNGGYSMTMMYPFDGIHASDIAHNSIIYAKPNQSDGNQAFRVTKIQETLGDKKLKITANHISYDLTGYPVTPFRVTDIGGALEGLKNNCVFLDMPFTLSTNMSNPTAIAFVVKKVKSLRNCLGGEEGSIIDTFGGELKFDNFNVSVLSSRGSNNGVSIRYAKNMESFVNVRSIESAYDGVISYYASGDTVVHGGVVYASNSSAFPTHKIYIHDATSKFDSTPTLSQLNAESSRYITANSIGRAYIDTVTVSFVPLWQTEEYKNFKDFETVSLGDTVNVIYKNFNTSIRAVEYTFDVLAERYTEMVLGQKKTTLYKTIREIV